MLKFIGALVCSVLFASSIARADIATADFKGKDDTSEFGVGALAGMGILDNHAGFALLPTLAKKIVNRGFVPDITNNVWIEVEAGPLFVSGGTAFTYSAHLRWNFDKDAQWTLYALGGLGGDVTGASLGDRFELYPRFALGAILRVAPNISLRGEISHEFIGLGILFPL
jgi:hypothetical protein